LNKDDLKNLKYWVCEDSTECEAIILTGQYSKLQLIILPPEFSYLAVPIVDVEARPWVVRLTYFGQFSTLTPTTLAQGETLDEILLPLKDYIDQYGKSFDETLAALETMEGAGLVIEDPLTLAGRLVESFADAAIRITPTLVAKRVVSGGLFRDAVGVVASKYEYETLLQTMVDLGVEKEEAEERIWTFERAHDVGEQIKPEDRAARA